MSVKKKTKEARKPAGGKFLVIVESPAKSKTIHKILGPDYKVIATMGHMIDLPESRMGIDFENDFAPEYHVIKGRSKYLKEVKKEAKEASKVYLAADPDREGEAICWHIKNQIQRPDEDVFRVRFEEITSGAVRKAFETAGSLDMNKVNAQQARRVLDRIVGYSLSPLLWGRITRGLSAGRVQSVAVRLIVEREEEIKKFKSEEYWSVEALLGKKGSVPKGSSDRFKAKLAKYRNEKVHIRKKEEADEITRKLKTEKFVVSGVKKDEKKSYPRSPYTTSVLQQDAFNKLNFSASKTMLTAQRLYEGVELGIEGRVGLITYMRTDSVRISEDALKDARVYIEKKYGGKYLPEKPTFFKSRKGAQEAHEAIRPALPLRRPEEVAAFLTPDELKLYRLIWQRFIASQMQSAVYSVLAVNIGAGEYTFKAGGASLVFDGFLRVYREYGMESDLALVELPPLEKGEEVSLLKLHAEQHFTKPPARYSDASLVKVLEEKGIGRPSTYAPTIRTILDRNYVKRISRYFRPTELGELVTKLLVESFPDIFDYEFTAKMEGELDDIEDGKMGWTAVVRDFYDPFSRKLAKAMKRVENINKEEVRTEENCPECDKPLIVKWGRRGRFLSCSAFPTCRFSKSIATGVKCPIAHCGGELIERRSRRGVFYGCTNYPRCTFTSRTLPGDKAQEGGEEGAVEDA